MQVTAPSVFNRWREYLTLAIRHLRQPDPLAAPADAIHQLVPIESSMINPERKGHMSTLPYERGIAECSRKATTRHYFSRGYLLDPFCLAMEESFPEGFYTLGEIAPDDFLQSAYCQTHCFGAGAVEDVYYIFDLDPTKKLSICLYDGPSVSRYNGAWVAAPTGLAPPVPEPARQFYTGRADFSPNPQADLAPYLQEIPRGFDRGTFTDREHGACYLLLSDHSTKSSAWLMDTSPETVRMYRKNLHTKLKVGSRLELFTPFIEYLSQGQHAGP